MSEDGRTLEKTVTELRLSESSDLEALFPPAFGRLRLWADLVTVEGRVRLPGRSLEIRAREIRPLASEKSPACLDVSGAAPEPDYDPKKAVPALDGKPTAADGKPGAPGGPGRPAGSVTIVAGSIDGALQVRAEGGRGGNSQRGGKGVRPRKRDGVDGKFKRAKWPARGPHGGGVLHKASAVHAYVAWAAGQPGGDAAKGGDAGAPGEPGDGGRGGDVEVRLVAPESPLPAVGNDGGAAGLAGSPSSAGKVGARGIGGRNQIYWYTVFSGENWSYARSGKDKTADKFAKEYKIPARAKSGKGGAADGSVPPQPEAQPGAAGRQSLERIGFAGIAGEFPDDYLALIRARARRDLAQGETERALERYRWLAGLAGSDPERAALQAEAAERVAEIEGARSAAQ